MFIYNLLKSFAGYRFTAVIWLTWQLQPGDMPDPEEFDAEDDLEEDLFVPGEESDDDEDFDETDDLLTDEEDDISLSADDEEE